MYMISELKQQDVDLWEAWIDFQTTNETNCPTLYVVGDVFTDDRFSQPYFIKREHFDPQVLALEILPGIASEDGYVTEVLYAEELEDINQYKSIVIYASGELVTSILDIEKIN